MIEQQVLQFSKKLTELGIKHSIVEHPHLKAVQEVQDFLGLLLSDGFSSLVMKADSDFISVVRRDDHRLDFNKIKKLLKAKSLRPATKEEFVNLTGLEIGAAQAFVPDTKTILDPRLFEKQALIGGSGSFTSSIRYVSEDLRKIPGSLVADVVEEVTHTGIIKRVVSGITPSGSELHIGNYFGAVKPHIELQNSDAETFYFVADLHALTTIKDRDQLERNVHGVVLDYLALGLDPEKSVFFRQSDVPEHSELAVVLANYVSLGQMKRMHAFKDKLQKGADQESINMGLFNYPILMAADILLYKPDGVPVGEDQRQHVELTRDIADAFNKSYGKETLRLPQPLISESLGRIVGTDGERKMSKSLGNVISIFEDEQLIKQQIMRCFTDPKRIHPTDPGTIEGNTVFVYHDLLNENKEEVADLKERYTKGTVGDVEVKQKLYDAHLKTFSKAREKRKQLEQDVEEVKQILARGAQKARTVASQTLFEVYETIGIVNELNIR